MAEIFSTPEHIEVPKIDFANFDQVEHKKKEDKFIEEIRSSLKKANPDDEHCGKIIQFPVADSYAMYMVFTVNPVQLIHLPLGDAWDFQYAENLTSQNVMDKISQQEAMEKLFSKHK